MLASEIRVAPEGWRARLEVAARLQWTIAANLPEEGAPDADPDAAFMGRFPAIARIGDYPFDLDRLFAFGLNSLLDGFAGFVEQR